MVGIGSWGLIGDERNGHIPLIPIKGWSKHRIVNQRPGEAV
jgi:hypothetical protein